MSYSVDLEREDLLCGSQAAAERAAELIYSHPWMQHHVRVSVQKCPDYETSETWHLAVEEFDACGWNERAALQVWSTIAPNMADGAFLEFRHEDASRFRIRWQSGRAYLQEPTQIVWGGDLELTPQALRDWP